jgi:hypothetical protein
VCQEDVEFWNRESGVGGHVGYKFVAEVEDHARSPQTGIVRKAYLKFGNSVIYGSLTARPKSKPTTNADHRN